MLWLIQVMGKHLLEDAAGTRWFTPLLNCNSKNVLYGFLFNNVSVMTWSMITVFLFRTSYPSHCLYLFNITFQVLKCCVCVCMCVLKEKNNQTPKTPYIYTHIYKRTFQIIESSCWPSTAKSTTELCLSATSIHLLHIPMGNESTTAWAACSSQNFIWKVWELFLIANQNLHWCNLRPLPLLLYGTWETDIYLSTAFLRWF